MQRVGAFRAVPNTTSLPPWWKRTAMAWQVVRPPAGRPGPRSCLPAGEQRGDVIVVLPRHCAHFRAFNPGPSWRRTSLRLEVDGVAHLQRAKKPV